MYKNRQVNMKEAMYYKKADNGTVQCHLCPHHCRIALGQVGTCRVRQNIDGKLYIANYGRVSSWGMDPIEKSLYIISIPVDKYFLWAALGAISDVNFARTGKLRS